MIEDQARRRLRDALYADALLLADEARDWFEGAGRREDAGPDPLARVALACEALKVTTRIMHVVAWLLGRRAVDEGEVAPEEAAWRLGEAPATEASALAALPARARPLVEASIALHRRAALLDGKGGTTEFSPVQEMQDRLARTF